MRFKKNQKVLKKKKFFFEHFWDFRIKVLWPKKSEFKFRTPKNDALTVFFSKKTFFFER